MYIRCAVSCVQCCLALYIYIYNNIQYTFVRIWITQTRLWGMLVYCLSYSHRWVSIWNFQCSVFSSGWLLLLSLIFFVNFLFFSMHFFWSDRCSWNSLGFLQFQIEASKHTEWSLKMPSVLLYILRWVLNCMLSFILHALLQYMCANASWYVVCIVSHVLCLITCFCTHINSKWEFNTRNYCHSFVLELCVVFALAVWLLGTAEQGLQTKSVCVSYCYCIKYYTHYCYLPIFVLLFSMLSERFVVLGHNCLLRFSFCTFFFFSFFQFVESLVCNVVFVFAVCEVFLRICIARMAMLCLLPAFHV